MSSLSLNYVTPTTATTTTTVRLLVLEGLCYFFDSERLVSSRTRDRDPSRQSILRNIFDPLRHVN